VRDVPTHTQPLRVVLDTHAQLPAGAKLLAAPGQALVIHGPDASTTLPSWTAPVNNKGRLNLQAVLTHLGSLDVNEVHIEAGHKLNGSLLKAGLVDELLVYVAPHLLGPGQAMAALPELQSLPATAAWQFTDHTTLGPDLRVRLKAVR
jgi:diaminohydroxyphosphoribosylaminopyrimidine deaminase/5-amino-6-(5-phosphoribosylamino)uracil reductase